jgi:hypothetical protein
MSTERSAYAVVLVPSTSHALRLEKLLLQREVPSKLIPVPRKISSDCGVCIRIRRADTETVRSLVHEVGLEIEEIHDI